MRELIYPFMVLLAVALFGWLFILFAVFGGAA